MAEDITFISRHNKFQKGTSRFLKSGIIPRLLLRMSTRPGRVIQICAGRLWLLFVFLHLFPFNIRCWTFDFHFFFNKPCTVPRRKNNLALMGQRGHNKDEFIVSER